MKAPEYQWGPREERDGKKYTAVFALEDLLDHGEIEGFVQDSFKRGDHSHLQFFHIRWKSDETDTQTAVHATDYLDGNGGVPFGIERDLILRNKVSEVLILCGTRQCFYRIPATAWPMLDPRPNSQDRFTSVVSDTHSVSSTGADIRQFVHRLRTDLNKPCRD